MIERSFENDRPLELWNDGTALIGYAAVFYREGDASTEYRPFDGLIERLAPGAFRDIIKRGDEVLALVNHDMAQVLGRRSANTLVIEEDKVGLRYKVDLADTGLARDTAANVRHGNYGGSSIGFRAKSVESTVNGDNTIRMIKEVDTLRDVGPVTEPAFKGTSVSARCAAQLEAQFMAELRAERLRELEKQLT